MIADKKISPSFVEAPGWNQDIASARAELLEQAEKYVVIHSPEFGSTKALERFLKAYNKGFVCKDIRSRLKRMRIRRSTYYNWLKLYKNHGLFGLLEGYGKLLISRKR